MSRLRVVNWKLIYSFEIINKTHCIYTKNVVVSVLGIYQNGQHISYFKIHNDFLSIQDGSSKYMNHDRIYNFIICSLLSFKHKLHEINNLFEDVNRGKFKLYKEIFSSILHILYY